jgi:hypothetical protein
MDFYYHGAWRMDWGFQNPNKTAVFIACLMLALWLAACVWRRGFWLALPAFTGLGYCLVHTYSRGGMGESTGRCRRGSDLDRGVVHHPGEGGITLWPGLVQ